MLPSADATSPLPRVQPAGREASAQCAHTRGARTCGDAALEVLDAALEVGEEEGRLGFLYLAVLHWCAAQLVVQLDRLVGCTCVPKRSAVWGGRREAAAQGHEGARSPTCGAVLILGRLIADPEVHVPRELVRIDLRVLDVGVQDDVAVARVELAVLRFGPRLHLELFDPPDLEADLDASAVPLRFAIGRRCLDLLLNLRTCTTRCVSSAARRDAVR